MYPKPDRLPLPRQFPLLSLSSFKVIIDPWDAVTPGGYPLCLACCTIVHQLTERLIILPNRVIHGGRSGRVQAGSGQRPQNSLVYVLELAAGGE